MMSSSTLPIVTIIGSLNTDFITNTPRVPGPGETLTATSFTTGFGGKGANQAVACARLSRTRPQSSNPTTANGPQKVAAEVHMVGAVAADTFGEDLIKNLQTDGIGTTGVSVIKKEGIRTGVANILVESSGENRILFCPGANYELYPSSFKNLPTPNPDLLVLQLEIRQDTMEQVVKTAQQEGIPVCLNPAPAPAAGLNPEVYQGLIHLIMNETEAITLSDKPDATDVDIDTLQSFLRRGVENVVVTLGGRGAFYMSSHNAAALGHVPAPKVTVVDTTAAGDTFVGAYAVAAAKASKAGVKFDLKAAVELGCRASGVTVTRKGAQEAIPYEDEVV